MYLVVALVVSVLLSSVVNAESCIGSSESSNTTDPDLEPDEDQLKWPKLPQYKLDSKVASNLGVYSARYTVCSKISTKVPKGCKVTMVNVLQRHGARYPTKGGGKGIDAALEKVRRAKGVEDAKLKFAPTFEYKYTADQLVQFGREQMYISGQIIAKRYSHLGKGKFIRSAKKVRIVESARWWRQGFEGGPLDTPVSSLPEPDLIITVANNTLSPSTCTAAEIQEPKRGDIAAQIWMAKYASPITSRLNEFLPGANLNNKDTVALIGLCGFDTAAKHGTASPWCDVFKKEEFRSYEYMADLEKYYSNSYGSKYGRSEGVGWVNELLARLTGRPVQDNTTANLTLDSNPTTFPIGPTAPRVFADFSSDNNIGKLLSAMGIFHDKSHLPVKGPIPDKHQFYVSRIVPFAGTAVIERITCPKKDAELKRGSYVRVIVNDAVVPLSFSPCGKMGEKSGICSLQAFVASQMFARSGGNWASCFVKG